MRKKDLPDIEPVILPEKWGMRPGLYITIFAAATLIAVCFCLFILPGLLSDSSYIAFDFRASGISIYEDGRYLGSSEGSVYKSTAGYHKYEFYFGSEKIGEAEVHNPRRILFSLFHKRINRIEPAIIATPAAIEKNISSFAENAVAWSRIYEHGEGYHVPPFYSEFAENAVTFGCPAEEIQKAMIYGAMHITSRELFDDFTQAVGILEENGIPIDISDFESTLSMLYDGDGVTKMRSSSDIAYEGTKDGDMFRYDQYNDVAMGTDAIRITYPDTNTYPVTVSAGGFSISQRAVTEYEYALFAEANPKWAKSNTESLIAEGLVDAGYLNGITLSTRIASQKPIRAISYYAAEAYTEWLSEKEGRSYSLPTEAEWYIAEESVPGRKYYSSLIAMDRSGEYPIGMLGQLWEFTCTDYIPLARVFDYKYTDPYGYDDIVIKGGSYVSNGITGESVGVISKSETSEYVGFRVVSHE